MRHLRGSAARRHVVRRCPSTPAATGLQEELRRDRPSWPAQRRRVRATCRRCRRACPTRLVEEGTTLPSAALRRRTRVSGRRAESGHPRGLGAGRRRSRSAAAGEARPCPCVGTLRHGLGVFEGHGSSGPAGRSRLRRPAGHRHASDPGHPRGSRDPQVAQRLCRLVGQPDVQGARLGVASVYFRIGAMLLDDEDIHPQAQRGVQGVEHRDRRSPYVQGGRVAHPAIMAGARTASSDNGRRDERIPVGVAGAARGGVRGRRTHACGQPRQRLLERLPWVEDFSEPTVKFIGRWNSPAGSASSCWPSPASRRS